VWILKRGSRFISEIPALGIKPGGNGASIALASDLINGATNRAHAIGNPDRLIVAIMGEHLFFLLLIVLWI